VSIKHIVQSTRDFSRLIAGHSGASEKRAPLLTRRSKAFNEDWHELSSRDLAALETGWDG
jgi:hypothetical protein